jgi:hypothetical protein
MEGKGFVVVIDFEHHRDAVEIKDTEVVFLVRIVGVTEVIVDGEGQKQTIYRFRSEFGDAAGNDGSAAEKVFPQFVVERTRAFRVRLHGHGLILQNVYGLLLAVRRQADWGKSSGRSPSSGIRGPLLWTRVDERDLRYVAHIGAFVWVVAEAERQNMILALDDHTRPIAIFYRAVVWR